MDLKCPVRRLVVMTTKGKIASRAAWSRAPHCRSKCCGLSDQRHRHLGEVEVTDLLGWSRAPHCRSKRCGLSDQRHRHLGGIEVTDLLGWRRAPHCRSKRCGLRSDHDSDSKSPDPPQRSADQIERVECSILVRCRRHKANGAAAAHVARARASADVVRVTLQPTRDEDSVTLKLGSPVAHAAGNAGSDGRRVERRRRRRQGREPARSRAVRLHEGQAHLHAGHGVPVLADRADGSLCWR